MLQAPKHRRKLRTWRHQWLGLPLLFAIPMLAVSGVFGESMKTAQGGGAKVTLSVEYPDRFRYKQIQPLEVMVRNVSERKLAEVELRFDANYIGQFSSVRFTPSAEGAYQVKLKDLAPGESRLVAVELQAENYGRHEGTILARVGGKDSSQVGVSTFVFP